MKLHVVVGLDDKGEEVLDTFEHPELAFVTEPSGVLSIFTGEYVCTAYAAGAWLIVREPQQPEGAS